MKQKEITNFKLRDFEIWKDEDNWKMVFGDNEHQFTSKETSMNKIVYEFEKMITNKKIGINDWKEKNTSVSIEHAVALVKKRILNLNIVAKDLFKVYSETEEIDPMLSGKYEDYIFFNIKKEWIFAIAEELTHSKFLVCKNQSIYNGRASLMKYMLPIRSLLTTKNKKQIFLVSEFNDLNDKINKKIKKHFEQKGWICILMNVDPNFGNIDLAIQKYISESEWIIANLSYKEGKYWNPNVFFELGMAKGYSKKTIMFLDEDQFPNEKNQLPFDINSHTCIKWEKNKEQEFISKLDSVI